MPGRPPLLGIEMPRGSAQERKSPQHGTTRAAQPPIPIMRWARNGKYPDAWMLNAMNEALNQAAMQRPKEVFHYLGDPNTFARTSVVGTRNRWRWYFHTGPLTHQLAVVCVLGSPTNSAPAASAASSAACAIRTPLGGPVGGEEFFYGPSPTGTGGYNIGWPYLKTITKYIAVDPDTDYQGLLADVNYGKLVSACVYEVPSMTTHNGGYMPQNLPAGAPILATDRQKLMELARLLWRRGGAHIMNWCVDDSSNSPRSTTSSTARNIVDDASTAVSVSTPGFTFDMRYQDRVSQTSGVPCVIAAYGVKTASATFDGTVTLKDSTGATVVTLANQWNNAGATWATAAFNLPATVAKYDLHYSRAVAASAFQLHAVSIFPYEP